MTEFINDRRPPKGERGMCAIAGGGWQYADDGRMRWFALAIKTAMVRYDIGTLLQYTGWRWATISEMVEAGATPEQAREMAHPSMLQHPENKDFPWPWQFIFKGKIEDDPNAGMLLRDGPAKRVLVITPAPTFYTQPRNDGLLTVAQISAKAWGL